MTDTAYGSGAGAVAADKLARLGWIGPATWVSVETAKAEALDLPQFSVDAERNYGKARITILRLI